MWVRLPPRAPLFLVEAPSGVLISFLLPCASSPFFSLLCSSPHPHPGHALTLHVSTLVSTATFIPVTRRCQFCAKHSRSQATVEAAQREGFTPQTIIYLDIEEGGRLSPKYHRYIIQWLWHVSPFYFRGGFYCSGIAVKEGNGKTITACEDILNDFAPRSREFSIWAYNDMCPPSPGCTFPENPPSPSVSGKELCETCIAVWQFAQSPRRKEFTAHCPAKYHKDGNCYAPNDTAHKWFIDVNTATSPDPSGGAK